MTCRKAFVALDHSLRHMRVGEEIEVKDDEKAPMDMWAFVRKYKPLRFAIRRAIGVYKIRRRRDWD